MISESQIQSMAIMAIRNYLNVNGKDLWTDDYIYFNYETAIALIIDNYKNMIEVNNGISNISSISQGGQSISFNSNSNLLINDEVKLLLPRPFIRLY